MKTTVTFLTVLLASLLTNAQQVRTIEEGGFFDDLFIHPNGILYGSDYYGNTVYTFNIATEEVGIFKDNFQNPNGIAMNPQEELFICDHTANTIFKFDPDGTILETYEEIFTPSGVKNIPGTNDMVFVEYATNRVGKLMPDGSTEILYSGAPINGPAGIAFIDEVLYISNYKDRKIIKLDNGEKTEIAQLPAESSINNFLGFIDARDGFIYATNISGHKIYKINPEDGSYFAWAGSTQGNADGPIEEATFNSPNGILFDLAADRLYISDGGTKNLRIIEDASLGFETTSALDFNLKLYPNPSQTTVSLKGDLPNTNTYVLNIYGINGKRIQKLKRTGSTKIIEEIEVSSWNTGTYLIEIQAGSYIQAIRFIKK